MQNRKRRDRKRKKEEREEQKDIKGQSIYAEVEITRISDIFQYLLRIRSFMRVFSLELESSS